MIEKLANQIRKKCVEISKISTGCHLGGSLSATDILAVLFAKCYEPTRGDTIILSKGHCAAALYATLYELGLIAYDPAITYGQRDSLFTGHPNDKIPHIYFSTGSLGHGLSLGLGWALGQQLSKTNGMTYVIVGDGELQEGSCWEALQVAASKKIKNFIVIVDKNKAQNDGWIKDISPVDNLIEKAKSFGMHVITVNGHDHAALYESVYSYQTEPLFIVAETTKGKGIHQLENNYKAHYVTAKVDIAAQWLRELGA